MGWERKHISNPSILLLTKLPNEGENAGSIWDAAAIISSPLLFPLVYREPVFIWESNTDAKVRLAMQWYISIGLLGDDGYARRTALHNNIKIGHWRNVLELNSCHLVFWHSWSTWRNSPWKLESTDYLQQFSQVKNMFL